MLLQLLLCWAPALAPPAPASLPQDPKRTEEFETRFSAAMGIEDIQEMEKLLRRFKDEAVPLFLAKAERRALMGGRELNRWVDTFIEAWSRAFRSDFARNYDRYMQLLDSRLRASRDETLRVTLPVVNDAFLKAFASRKGSDWTIVRKNLEPMLRAFDNVGDLYYLAYSYKIQGFAWNTDNADDGGDDKMAMEAFEKFIATREKLELTQDSDFNLIQQTLRQVRARLGVADPETGEVPEREISPNEILPEEGAEWIEIALEPGLEEKVGSVEHGSDLSDEHRVSWRPGGVAGVGSESEIYFVKPRTTIKRVGFNSFQLHAGADPSEEFKISTRPIDVPYQRKHEDGRVTDHVLTIAGGLDKDDYNGTQMNFSMGDENVFFFYRSTATRTAKTPAGPITIYDLNGDGRFGTDQLELTGAMGMPPETFLYRLDAVLLGKGKHSVPFSRWIHTGDGDWYELDMKDHAGGESLRLRKANPNLTEVKVTAKGYRGVKLVSLVFESESRHTKGLLVDVMAGKKGRTSIPAGEYVFRQGLLRGQKGQEAVILPPANAPWRIEAVAGEPLDLKLGAPFTLDAHFTMEGKNVLVSGPSLHVKGSAGERYVRLVGAPLFRAEIAAKGVRPASFDAPEVNDVNIDWNAAYWPKDVFLAVGKSERPPLRLTLKKHPWFGNLDSGWIE